MRNLLIHGKGKTIGQGEKSCCEQSSQSKIL